MGDMKDIEPNCWRAEREITSVNTVQTIISSFLHLQSCLFTYVSNEDMEEMFDARKAFDSKQMDIHDILAFIQEARQKAEERQAIKKGSLEDLQQTLSRVLATTENWPSPLRSEITKRCETEQRWLDSMCDKATGSRTAGEITTRFKKQVEDIEAHIKNLNDYFEFAKDNAKLPEEPKDIPHFHVHWRASKSDWMLGMTPIKIYDTHDWVFGQSRFPTTKCEKSGCPSLGKPHSHVSDDSKCDVEGSYFLLLCKNLNCELKHAHPQFFDDYWIFGLTCNQDCDCMKHNRRPFYMPKKAEVFEHPIPV